jgi:tRNA pseudouridine38-40 synthase
MHRYFLEVSYNGSDYSGFQSQHNANTIQTEIERAIEILLKEHVFLTGSSRTDAGVHALKNYFHFDTEIQCQAFNSMGNHFPLLYKLNAILPGDIVVNKIYKVSLDAHCRFDAVSRFYSYYIYQFKNPFLRDRAFYFPFKLDIERMQMAASIVREYSDFTSFSKRNTQVKTFICKIEESVWTFKDGCLIYNVRANRFLRGMVRALVATMLQVGRGKISLDEFKEIIEAKNCTKASFAVPAHGLFLINVNYIPEYFKRISN